jgi:hypothetical protein
MATQFIHRERGPNLSPLLAGYAYTTERARYGVVVRKVAGADCPTFTATAYRVDGSGARTPVVNEDGRPLVAVGSTPVKATSYLMSALRRRNL